MFLQQYFVGKFNCPIGKSILTDHKYMDYTPITLQLPSHVILDMFWIQVEVDLEIQLTALDPPLLVSRPYPKLHEKVSVVPKGYSPFTGGLLK